jgi:hypothetical protein
MFATSKGNPKVTRVRLERDLAEAISAHVEGGFASFIGSAGKRDLAATRSCKSHRRRIRTIDGMRAPPQDQRLSMQPFGGCSDGAQAMASRPKNKKSP